MPKRSIQSLLEERYDDPEVRDHVRASIETAGTLQAILDGHLVLPHEIDATKSHIAATGRTASVRKDEELEKRLHDLEAIIVQYQSQESK